MQDRVACAAAFSLSCCSSLSQILHRHTLSSMTLFFLGGPCRSRFIVTGGGRSALTPTSANFLSLSGIPRILNMLGEGSPQPLPAPLCFQSLPASTWPHPTPASTKAVFAEVDGLCQTTLCIYILIGRTNNGSTHPWVCPG